MQSRIMSKYWFDDIKDYVRHEDVYVFDEYGMTMVQVDVDEEQFCKVSTERGWM